MYTPCLLRPEEVLEHWSTIKPHIDVALEHSAGEMTTFQLFQKAMTGQVHVFAAIVEGEIHNVLTTRFLIYDNMRSLQLLTCGGKITNWDAWLDHNHLLEKFAKENKCNSIQIWGRKGWGRRLSSVKSTAGKPYKSLYSVYSMEITND